MPTYEMTNGDLLSFDATPLIVARHHLEDDTYEMLGYVRVLQVQWFEGAKPPAARLAYVFDNSDLSGYYPTQFEQVWPLTATSPGAIRQDDEIVIYEMGPNGKWYVLFQGYAQVPQVDVTPQGQHVTFTAVGMPIRCFDDPIGGAYYREGEYPLTGEEVATDLTSRFNPDRRGNCTLAGYDENDGSTDPATPPYPVFIDARLTPVTETQFWTLGGFVRYILGKYNDRLYVENPDFSTLDVRLQEWSPADAWFDPLDPESWLGRDIVIRDVVADGRLWPELLEQVLRHHGFSFCWVLTSAGEDDPTENEPEWSLEIFRLDSGRDPETKVLTLPPLGGSVALDFANLGSIGVTRDHNAVFNAVEIDTDPTLYEVDIILAPLFDFSATDYGDTYAHNWDRGVVEEDTQLTAAKYRWWGADECGEGHWDDVSNSYVTTTAQAFDFDYAFGGVDSDGTKQWVTRRRPGRNTLNSTDDKKKPIESSLWICTDWTPPAEDIPGPWDGESGTWQKVADGAWRLLSDRLGVELLCDSPTEWRVGKGGVFPSGVVNIIGSLNSLSGHPTFNLSLTTVIEGDKGLGVKVHKRLSSPGNYEVTRRLDARDHFRKRVVLANTTYNPDPEDLVIRDDTDAAESYAGSVQAAHQYPRVAGSVAIPFITFSYRIGDRIREIAGRGVSLRTNAGDAEEAPYYPMVVAVAWDFAGGQKTTLQLADRRGEVQSITASATLGL